MFFPRGLPPPDPGSKFIAVVQQTAAAFGVITQDDEVIDENEMTHETLVSREEELLCGEYQEDVVASDSLVTATEGSTGS